MVGIYYFLFMMIGLTTEVYNFEKISKPSKIREKVKNWYNLKEDERNPKDKPDGGEVFKYLMYYVFQLSYSLLGFIGIFSSQWVLFLIVIILGFAPKKLRKVDIYGYFDAIISIIIILFIVLNKYHFHIDLYHLIIK